MVIRFNIEDEITWSSEGGDSDYELIKHPMIINSFSENFNITENNSLLQNQDREMETGDYTTYNFPNPQQEGSTFYLPKIWSLRSTTGDSFSDILQNWLTMRGISVPPVHPVARQLSHDSPQSNFSLQDFVNHKEREVNLGPLQLNLETPMGYRSKKKYGSTTINSEVIITDSDELGRNPNIIQNVLKAYIGNDSNFSDTLKNYQNVLLGSLLKTDKLSGGTSNSTSIRTILGSKKVFKQQVDSIIEDYPTAFVKYNNLIHYIITNNVIPGVDDNQQILSWSQMSPLTKTMLINQIPRLSGLNASTRRFSDHLNRTQLGKMAAAFALSEVLIKNNLSNSFIGDIGSPGSNNDTHSLGSVGSLYFYSKYYYCLLNCLQTLKNSIGEKFSKTTFQISGDFNRNPLLNEWLDHDSSNVISYLTGKITNGHFFGGLAEDQWKGYLLRN